MRRDRYRVGNDAKSISDDREDYRAIKNRGSRITDNAKVATRACVPPATVMATWPCE